MLFSSELLCRFSAVGVLVLALPACSVFNNASGRISNLGGIISPYKPDVVQGNFVSQEQKDALQVGMQRAQVRDILGSPLVTSAFHADRWDYVFTIFRQGQEPQQRKLAVFFKGDVLAKVDGDALMSEEEFVKSLSVGRNVGKVPVLEASADSLKAAAGTAPPSGAISADTGAAPARAYPPLEPAAR